MDVYKAPNTCATSHMQTKMSFDMGIQTKTHCWVNKARGALSFKIVHPLHYFHKHPHPFSKALVHGQVKGKGQGVKPKSHPTIDTTLATFKGISKESNTQMENEEVTKTQLGTTTGNQIHSV